MSSALGCAQGRERRHPLIGKTVQIKSTVFHHRSHQRGVAGSRTHHPPRNTRIRQQTNQKIQLNFAAGLFGVGNVKVCLVLAIHVNGIIWE
jgi:hypothetical protein